MPGDAHGQARLRLARVVLCDHGRRGCGRGACRTCARQHPRRQSGGCIIDQKKGKMAPCGLGCRLCRSSGWPHRLGTSVFATSSAERSLELDESFQAIQCRPPDSQGLARYGEGGGGCLGGVNLVDCICTRVKRASRRNLPVRAPLGRGTCPRPRRGPWCESMLA